MLSMVHAGKKKKDSGKVKWLAQSQYWYVLDPGFESKSDSKAQDLNLSIFKTGLVILPLWYPQRSSGGSKAIRMVQGISRSNSLKLYVWQIYQENNHRNQT
jgi:hypothetical protein